MKGKKPSQKKSKDEIEVLKSQLVRVLAAEEKNIL